MNDAINKLPNEAERIKFRQTQPVDISAISSSNHLSLFGGESSNKSAIPVVQDVVIVGGPSQGARRA